MPQELSKFWEKASQKAVISAVEVERVVEVAVVVEVLVVVVGE